MKKLLFAVLLISLILVLTACNKDKTDPKFEDQSTTVVAVLEEEGFVLTKHDQDSCQYFQDNTVANLGLDLNVIELYIGYLDSGSWVQIIAFDSENSATQFKEAYLLDDSTILTYQDQNSVLLTYTQATIDLFN
ncbi:MAG: hypothetical protein KJ847_00420 [Firmicutes bacterium]|nr:hypothetical protein [Bacillota bacterium]